MLAEFYALHGFWVWAAIAAAILAVEVVTGSGWLLWPSASAAVVAVLSLVTDSAAVEIAVFAVLTIVTTLLARRFWPARAREGADINDNIARLMGHRGRVAASFGGGSGRVAIDGKEWAADLEEGDELPAGAEVEVTGLSGGSRLRVRPCR
jgi:hypothetical protein